MELARHTVVPHLRVQVVYSVYISITVPPLPPNVANPDDIDVELTVAVYNTTLGEGPTSANCSSGRTRFSYESRCASALFDLAQQRGGPEVLTVLLEAASRSENAFTGSFQCTNNVNHTRRTCIDHYRPPGLETDSSITDFVSARDTRLPRAFEQYCEREPRTDNSWSSLSCFALG